MNQYEKVKKAIFGKEFELKVYTDNYDYERKNKKQPLLKYEIEELDWILNYSLDDNFFIPRLLDLFNEDYYEIGLPEIDTIYPEADFRSIYIKKDNNGNIYLGLLGECNSDVDHGFSIQFKNREYYAVGQHSDLLTEFM